MATGMKCRHTRTAFFYPRIQWCYACGAFRLLRAFPAEWHYAKGRNGGGAPLCVSTTRVTAETRWVCPVGPRQPPPSLEVIP